MMIESHFMKYFCLYFAARKQPEAMIRAAMRCVQLFSKPQQSVGRKRQGYKIQLNR